ncbi:MAG: ATP synthase F0 subunit A [Elusimicrobia bacterium RIFOXYA2_FULL_39_19]|nr:MAG: ATP synthase F0 subunit A [Elusimicrobia bacterium RIFOXYA2_FULL_39_19]
MSVVPESIEYHLGAIPTTLAMTWLVWGILFVLSFITLKAYKHIPGKLQVVFEMCFEFVHKLSDDAIGPHAYRYYPLFISLFLFILVSNIIGLIPGFVSPTSDLNVTIALALIVFVYYNFQGFRKNGLGYIKHFFGPKLPWYLAPVNVLMFVIEIISSIARPFSLAVRLFCNILSKEILLGVLALLLIKFFFGETLFEKGLTLCPLILRPLIILLGVMIAAVQALIFLVLSIVYVSGAVSSQEH